jgi:hypothetical protein
MVSGGLIDRKATGAVPKLSASKKEEVQAIVEAGAKLSS